MKMEFILDNIGWIILLGTIGFIFFYKKLSKNEDALTGKFSKTVDFKVDPEGLPKKILNALKKSGFSKVRYDPDTERYYAKTKISIWSWTEFIEIQTLVKKDHIRLIVSSKCALAVQVIDWGKNKRNTQRFLTNFQNENQPSD